MAARAIAPQHLHHLHFHNIIIKAEQQQVQLTRSEANRNGHVQYGSAVL